MEIFWYSYDSERPGLFVLAEGRESALAALRQTRAGRLLPVAAGDFVCLGSVLPGTVIYMGRVGGHERPVRVSDSRTRP